MLILWWGAVGVGGPKLLGSLAGRGPSPWCARPSGGCRHSQASLTWMGQGHCNTGSRCPRRLRPPPRLRRSGVLGGGCTGEGTEQGRPRGKLAGRAAGAVGAPGAGVCSGALRTERGTQGRQLPLATLQIPGAFQQCVHRGCSQVGWPSPQGRGWGLGWVTHRGACLF